MDWVVLPEKTAVVKRVCKEIIQAADLSISRHGCFSLVLAGGNTPRQVYQRLAQSERDFTRWEFFLGDERCLPADHPDRNSQMIRYTLLESASIRMDQFHPIRAELGAEQAAQLYSQEIASFLPFDCVLLGLGEDGHTASLFPHQQHSADDRVIAVHHAPKPPADRVSLNESVLRESRLRLFMVTGSEKQSAVRRWKNDDPIPAARVAATSNTKVILDEAATGANGDK